MFKSDLPKWIIEVWDIKNPTTEYRYHEVWYSDSTFLMLWNLWRLTRKHYSSIKIYWHNGDIT